MKWKADWDVAKTNLTRWWAGKGLAVAIMAPRKGSLEDIPKPPAVSDPARAWTDPVYRCDKAEYDLSSTIFAGEAFPYFDTQMGPGSLGSFLGAQPHFAENTVWYSPCIADPDKSGPIRFDPNQEWFCANAALIDEGVRRAKGRFLVGIPDLIEGLDTLAAMRSSEELLTDLVDRPEWVEQRLAEINQAYFAAFDTLFQKARDADGGNAFAAFRIWGPGKTAKLQCDFSCMISPPMFARFVVPYLKEQCDWLDYSVYHLDGTTAVQHLEALLAIESLNCIQWTPQAGQPPVASPRWFPMYRRILAAGKGLLLLGIARDQIIPVIDKIGPRGVYTISRAPDQATAERLLLDLEPYRKAAQG